MQPGGILNARLLSVCKQIKTTLLQKKVGSLLHFAWKSFSPRRCQPTSWGPVNFGARVQSSQNCPIVGPTGGRGGCLWPPGGRFYKHRRRREFELQRWQKSSGLDGGHSRVTQWSSGAKNSQEREKVQLHNWNRQPATSPTEKQNWPKDRFREKNQGRVNWKIIVKLLNPTWWSVDCYQGLMGLFSGASNDLFCEKHYFLECKTCFRQSPRVLAVRELFNSHCPFNLIHGTFLTVCATESDISQNNEVFHVIMTIQEKNYDM